MKHCKKLESIALNDNDLTDLPEELSELENLTELFVSANRFARLPKIIPKLKNIYYLTVSNLMLPGEHSILFVSLDFLNSSSP